MDAGYGNAGSRVITVAEIATNITGMTLFESQVCLYGTTTTNIGGTNTYVFAAAIDTNGTFMNTFGNNGIAKFNTNPNLYISTDICISNIGQTYITHVKSFTEHDVMKLNLNGTLTLNNSWDTDGIVYVNTNNNQHWYEVADMDLDKKL